MVNTALALLVVVGLLLSPTRVCSLAISSSNSDASSLANTDSLRATSGTASSARVIFSAPSSMDPTATVEVKERSSGWRTVGLVGGRTKSIYHGLYKVDENGMLDATVIVSKYLQTMAAIAFASLEANETQENPSFLYLGLGGGSLSAFIHHYFQDSQHVAVELDEAVVSATESIRLKDYIDIQVGDALNFQRGPSQEPFDCIFVDIFDGDNLLPCEFYGEPFVTRMRDDLLTPSGVVVHNFHTGNPKLASQLAEAKDVFARSFESCYEVDSLDSKANAGNTILVGSKVDPCRSNKSIGDVLTSAAVKAQEKLGFPIDAASILADAKLVVLP